MPTIFSIHLAVTWMLVGLIWVIQIVVYPQFRRIAAAAFQEYHFSHCIRIGLVVVPLMLVEAASAAWLLYAGQRSLPFQISTGLIPVVWLSTVLIQAPAHLRLMRGIDARLIHRVLLSNWIRTLAWTARGILVSLSFP